ncbi:MFS transporter [Halothiobacillus diazotrophicus]|uniref:MFS transporter n=1 Tax=Halothiobacillus diazotrophicus TaxID=1860122 RepID=A0A191ZDY2_9GAMM|nr:MFS transporter [Halothiobacillus diazotrophicus]ANJ66074.1 MFS transporter [Halothiobacillus diazotrophicus]
MMPPNPNLPAAPRGVLAALSLAMLLPSLGTSIANVALPTFAATFQVPFHAVQWIVLAYLLAITTLIVSMGRLGDMIGHRRLLLLGILLFTAASLVCGLSPTFGLLVAARAVQGVGAAVLMALTIALVRDSVPKAQTGSAMGLLGTMSAIGTALGPSLGGLLLAGPGWRAIFLVIVPLGLLNGLLAWRYLPPDRTRDQPHDQTHERSQENTGAGNARSHVDQHGLALPRLDLSGFDFAGTLLLALALAAYALAVTTGSGSSGLDVFGLLTAAALAIGLFLRIERRAKMPLIQLSLLQDGARRAGLLMNLFIATVMMTTLVVGPFYLAHFLALGLAEVGLVMSIGPVISALSGVPAGRLVDRMGTARIMRMGLGAMALGSLGLSLLPNLIGVPGYIAAIALLTSGYQLFQAANNTAVMMAAPAAHRGALSGVLSLSRNLGLISGASVMGAVFTLGAGTNDLQTARAPQLATGMTITFAVATLLILFALGLSQRRQMTQAAPISNEKRAK